MRSALITILIFASTHPAFAKSKNTQSKIATEKKVDRKVSSDERLSSYGIFSACFQSTQKSAGGKFNFYQCTKEIFEDGRETPVMSKSRFLHFAVHLGDLRACTNEEAEFGKLMSPDPFDCVDVATAGKKKTAFFFWAPNGKIRHLRVF